MEWTRWIISVPKDIRWSRRCTSWGITSLKYRRSLQLILFERHNATPVTVYNNCTDVSIKLKLSFPTLFDVPTSFYGGIAGILSTILYTLKSDSNSIRFWCVSRFEEKKRLMKHAIVLQDYVTFQYQTSCDPLPKGKFDEKHLSNATVRFNWGIASVLEIWITFLVPYLCKAVTYEMIYKSCCRFFMFILPIQAAGAVEEATLDQYESNSFSSSYDSGK